MKSRQKVYKVKGKATFLGSPLIGATVSFAPTDTGPAAIGRTNDAGEFTLKTYESGDGAAAGNYKVTFILVDAGSAAKAPAIAHAPNQAAYVPTETHSQAETVASTANVLPAKYSDPAQTPLTATVDATKENSFTFELK